MIRTRYKKVLLVAPEIFPEQLIARYKNVKHICTMANVFPSIFQLNPDLVIFDFDFMGGDLEKVIRRIKVNKFYQNINIFCYKNDPNLKTDSLLRVLGVDQFIYKEDLIKAQKNKTVMNTVHSIIDTSIMKLVASVSN